MGESGTATVLSDRFAGEALVGVVGGTALSGGGPTTYNMSLPVGFGDCLLIDCMVVITGIATLAPTSSVMGCSYALQTADGLRRQIIGVGRTFQTYVDQVTSSPEKVMLPIIWRAEEQLFVTIPEIDTNASPTAAWNVWARVVRTRQ